MSSPPSTDENQTFENFFKTWLTEQNTHLHHLISAATSPAPELNALIERVTHHYEHYYKVKSKFINQNPMGMLNPSWTSNLEDAFLWIGGWRPTTAFHLLYSKSGFQLELHLPQIIRGLTTGDLADLSPDQVVQIDSLQKRTVKEEREISEKMAKYQESVADPSMVELSHVETKSIMEGEACGGGDVEVRLTMALQLKEEVLKETMEMADELRLKTFKEILGILTKMQEVHFLIAAAELHLRVHEWGSQRDHSRRD